MSNTVDVGYETNGYTLREAIVEAKRCLNCKKPMCRMGCPISNIFRIYRCIIAW